MFWQITHTLIETIVYNMYSHHATLNWLTISVLQTSPRNDDTDQ